MPLSRTLDIDVEAGIRRVFHADTDGEGFVIETIQEVSPLVEQNKALHAMTDERTRFGGDGLGGRVASIPMNVYADLQRRGIADNPAAFKRWLNDGDNRCFRTRPGVV